MLAHGLSLARPCLPGASFVLLALVPFLSCAGVRLPDRAQGVVPDTEAQGAGGPRDSRAAEVDAWLAEWDRPGSPGVAVLVAQGDETLYRGAAGSANLEYAVPITPATVFQSASLSKQITAFAIAMLAQQQRLSLDDEVRKYIPELADFGAPTTIRHLVHHTSGLRDAWELLFFAGWRREDVITHDHVLDLATHQRSLNFPSGEQFLYTNTGYTLLVEVIQRVTGRPFAAWVKENIFEPLEMHDTRVRDSLGELIEGRAYSYYALEGGGYENAPSNALMLGGSNVFTTVDDLVKWARNLDEGTLGGETLVRQVQTPGFMNDGTATNYAFGMYVRTQRGIRMVAHGGGVAGFRAYLLRAPEHRLTVIVLANLNTISAGALANRIATLYLGERMSPEPASEPVEEGGPATFAAAGWDDYVGTYLMSPGLTFTVRRRGGGMTVQATGEEEVEMGPVAAGRFIVDAYGSPIRFEPTSEGTFSLVFSGSTGTRAEAFTPTRRQLDEFVGEFHSVELRTTYTFVVRDEKLVLRHPRLGDIPVHPTIADQFGEDMADEFGNTGRWFRSFDFVRDRNGTITGLSLTVGGARNVRFDKR
jgi:CubicO group peptidase (beta-lactamase class C family)